MVHASDRLLTKRIAGKTRVHSDVENKSLIVLLKDAICIIGYTGAAYIGNVITDEWIASTITGLDLTEKFMMRQPGVRALCLNTMLRRLEFGLRGLRLPGSSNYLGIAVSGIRQRGRYVRSFIRELERNRGVVRSGGYMRYPHSPAFHQISQVGDPVSMRQLQLTIGQEFEGHGISAEAFRIGMFNTILNKARTSKVVGDEVMTITVTRSPESWDVVWKFNSQNPRFAAISNSEGQTQRVFKSYFSPWIISPAGITKPSFGNGHLEHVIGDVRVRCGNEPLGDDGQGLFMAVSSQDRMPND